MNLLGHTAIGIVTSLITCNPFSLLGSVLPDVILIPNELRMLRNGLEFNQDEISNYIVIMYRLTHSLWFPVLMAYINIYLGVGCILHILIDIPFHSGRLKWRPIYPL